MVFTTINEKEDSSSDEEEMDPLNIRDAFNPNRHYGAISYTNKITLATAGAEDVTCFVDWPILPDRKNTYKFKILKSWT
jgi:hypothetical protein